MIRPASPVTRRFAALASLASGMLLAGCASLLVARPPANLYRLSPAGNFPSTLPHASAQLLIDLPQAAAAIDTSRIALSRSAISLDYYADSEWTAAVPDLIESLLLASFENTGAITAIGRDSSGLRADFVLATEIRHFEAVYESAGAAPRIRVTIVARIIAKPQRRIVAQRRFERRVYASGNDLPAIVTAFDTATAGVLQDIVLWTLSDPSLSRSEH